MPTYRVRQVADLLGVSDDTVRRWAESGRLPAERDSAGRVVVQGEALARFADDLAQQVTPPVPATIGGTSADNRLAGVVTAVERGDVMSRVQIRCGPFRIVGALSSEALDGLNLRPGDLAVAAIDATAVTLEVPS